VALIMTASPEEDSLLTSASGDLIRLVVVKTATNASWSDEPFAKKGRASWQ
jgi:hypothetical protein